jgi:hypothetical protein
MLLELGEQRVFLGRAEVVARRMRHHGHAAGLRDPAHRVAQAGPAMRHVAGLALGEVLAKHLLRVAAHAGLDQKAREVRARDQRRVAHVPERALVGAGNAGLRQLRRRARGRAAVARVRQALHQLLIGRIEPQPDDVHRGVGEGDRDFDAAQVVHPWAWAAASARGWPPTSSWSVSAHRSTPPRARRGQVFGCQGAVGDDGVAVQVGVGVGAHRAILRSTSIAR